MASQVTMKKRSLGSVVSLIAFFSCHFKLGKRFFFTSVFNLRCEYNFYPNLQLVLKKVLQFWRGKKEDGEKCGEGVQGDG